MKKLYLLFLFSCFISEVYCDKNITDIKTFEESVKIWVDLRNELQSEKRVWEERKENITHQLNLYDKEKDELQKQIADMRSNLNGAKKEFDDFNISIKNNRELLKSIEKVINNAEEKLKSLIKLIPFSLYKDFNKNVTMLLEKKNNGFVQRLQNILNIYSEVERITGKIHLNNELITITNEENKITKECDVIYIGLANGFYLSKDEKFAGFGFIQNNKWLWIRDDSLVLNIKNAKEILEEKKTARFIDLPISVEKVNPL